jgi:hypothetical protein
VRTPILRGGRYGRVKSGLDPDAIAERFERLRPMDPSLLARRVLRAVERDRAIIIEPKWWRLFWYLDRFSPRLFEKLGESVLRAARRDLHPPRDG